MMTNFDDIRPFNADEIPAATQRMADSEVIPAIAQYLGVPAEALRERIRSIKTLKEFQLGLLKEVIETLLKKTTTQFDWAGLENIDEKKPYLFVSNHRDIVLDAMFLQYILTKAGQNTCQITFGSNLMSHPFVIDFGKVNKMFRTERGGSPKEFYNSMLHITFDWLSEYGDGHLKGFRQHVVVPCEVFGRLLETGAPATYLYRPHDAQARIDTSHVASVIQTISEDSVVRRALSKAMRDHFHWDADTVTLYRDGNRDFSFRTASGCPSAGGLILHQSSVRTPIGMRPKLYYGVHT